MDWGSAIFLKNWAALEPEERNVNLALTKIFYNVCDSDSFTYSSLPFVGGVIILNATLHVLQLVQHCKHVDKFAQSEQVGLRHKVLPSLSVTQTLHFTTETFYGFPLWKDREIWVIRNCLFARIHFKNHNFLCPKRHLKCLKFSGWVHRKKKRKDTVRQHSLTWKYMNFMSLVTSGSNTSTVFS